MRLLCFENGEVFGRCVCVCAWMKLAGHHRTGHDYLLRIIRWNTKLDSVSVVPVVNKMENENRTASPPTPTPTSTAKRYPQTFTWHIRTNCFGVCMRTRTVCLLCPCIHAQLPQRFINKNKFVNVRFAYAVKVQWNSHYGPLTSTPSAPVKSVPMDSNEMMKNIPEYSFSPLFMVFWVWFGVESDRLPSRWNRKTHLISMADVSWINIQQSKPRTKLIKIFDRGLTQILLLLFRFFFSPFLLLFVSHVRPVQILCQLRKHWTHVSLASIGFSVIWCVCVCASSIVTCHFTICGNSFETHINYSTGTEVYSNTLWRVRNDKLPKLLNKQNYDALASVAHLSTVCRVFYGISVWYLCGAGCVCCRLIVIMQHTSERELDSNIIIMIEQDGNGVDHSMYDEHVNIRTHIPDRLLRCFHQQNRWIERHRNTQMGTNQRIYVPSNRRMNKN